MPWTKNDVNRFKSGLTDSQKEQWVEVANSALQRCLNNGGSQQNCEASAIRQANGVVGNMQYITNRITNANIRRTTFHGRTHVVAPVVLMTEGVHHGSAGRILYIAEELSRMPVTWNGRPVPIMHPTDSDGSPRTCNDPDVLESQTVGQVFDVEWELQNCRLKGELWIDETKARQICSSLSLPDVIGMMDNGDPVEVSTGLFPEQSGEAGVWNGQEYDASAVGIHSDHLAILPGGTGACSWQDGCGVRNKGEELQTNLQKWTQEQGKNWLREHDFKISNVEKQANYWSFRQTSPGQYSEFRADKSPFGFDEGDGVIIIYGIKTEDGDRISEIQTVRFYHGEGDEQNQQSQGGQDAMKRTKLSRRQQINSELTINAIDYSSTESTEWSAPNLEDFGVETNRWSDLSQSERARVVAHFLIGSSRADDYGKLKFPVVSSSTGNLNERALRAVISGRGAQVEGVSADQRAAARRRAYNLLNEEFDAELEIPENLEAVDEKRHSMTANQVSEGYMEIMSQLQRKLDSMDNDFRIHFLEDFNDETVIYRVESRERGGDDKFYRQPYAANDDGSVELGGEPEEVNKKVDVSYVPVQQQQQSQNNNDGGNSMTRENNQGTQNQGCCPEKVEAVINGSGNSFTGDDREKLQAFDEQTIDKIPTEAPEPASNQVQDPTDVKNPDFNTLLQNTDPELRQSIERGRELYRQERQSLVQRILNNSNQFTQEELDQMDHAMLQKVANSIKPAANYKGAGGAPSTSEEELEEGIGEPWKQQAPTTEKQQ